MSILLFQERFNTRRLTDSLGANSQANRKYLVESDDADNPELEAKNYVRVYSPSNWDGLPRGDVRIEQEIKPGLYEISVDYTLETSQQEGSQQKPKEEGDKTAGFEISGQTQQITMSREEISKWPDAGVPASNKLIGFDGDSIQGMSLFVPQMGFSETFYFSNSFLSYGYRDKLLELAGTVNDATFRGGDAGSMMFVGVSGQPKDANLWELTFKFQYSPNESVVVPMPTNADPNREVTIPKDGWDYLDIRYKSDVKNNEFVQYAYQAYVHRVYERKDFSALQIGTN